MELRARQRHVEADVADDERKAVEDEVHRRSRHESEGEWSRDAAGVLGFEAVHAGSVAKGVVVWGANSLRKIVTVSAFSKDTAITHVRSLGPYANGTVALTYR